METFTFIYMPVNHAFWIRRMRIKLGIYTSVHFLEMQTNRPLVLLCQVHFDVNDSLAASFLPITLN